MASSASTGPAEIRPPVRSELRGCRMILPEAFRSGVMPDLLLAANPRPFRFLGALSYALVLLGGQHAWRMRLHVVRGHRRLGVGSQLVRAVAERAVRRGVRTLIGAQEDSEPDATAFLASLGFQHKFRSSEYEADLERYRDVVLPLRERLVERGRVPVGARIVAIDEAPRDSLSRLLTDHSTRTPDSIGTPWSDAWSRAPVREASVAVMLDQEVVGTILAERKGTSAEVIWRVVAPAYRAGWANVLLNAATWEQMHRHGVRRIRFTTTDNTPDTESFVRLYGAERSNSTNQFVLALDMPTGARL